MEALKARRKTSAMAFLICFLLVIDLNFALATSGGRMGGSMGGGSSFSSFRRSSWPWATNISSPPPTEPPPFGFIILAIIIYCIYRCAKERKAVNDCVLKLQVGLFNTGKLVQKDLNRIAETADTSTSEGVHSVLIETIRALEMYPHYWISTYSSVEVIQIFENSEKKFGELSNEESRKFKKETLINVNNIMTQSLMPMKQEPAKFKRDEYIVVTILVATNGNSPKLPTIKNKKDLKTAFQNLVSFPSTYITRVEVLWTPQDESDTLSKMEFLENYNLLTPLC